ncbi:MAG TPA: hypothetical protein VF310_10250 [Vicinamibacteria bacterium]
MNVRGVVLGVGTLALGLTLAASAEDGAERLARAEAVVKRAESASLREFAPAYRAQALRALAALDEEELQAHEKRDPSQGMGLLALGDSAAQLVYTPVAPCRIVDTRVAGGQLTPGSIRDFRVTGTSSLAGQGGSATGCNVPFGPATSAVINFVAVNPAGAGNLRAWAYSTPPVGPPNTSIINYTQVPGAVLNLANGMVVPLCDSDATTCPNLDLRVRADVAATHLVADVVGYFERFPKEQIRSFTVVDTQATDTLMGSSCTHVQGADITIVVPAPGRVVVRAVAVHDMVQNNGDDRVLVVGIGTTPTDCAFVNYGHSKIKDASFSETFLFTVPVTATFDVVPGTYNYYLNGFMPISPMNATVLAPSFMEATFYPN